MIVFKLLKHFFYIILIVKFANIYASDIEGFYIPQGKFDSAMPTVTMRLDKIHPPVIRVAPSRPTVVVFPIQVSRCFSDNKALKVEKADPIKPSSFQAGQESENFSAIILKVNGTAITEKFLDQTQISCLLIDSSLYPIGIEFTDVNAYSIVKLLEETSSIRSPNIDMDGYAAIRIGQNNHNNFKQRKKEERVIPEQIKEKKSLDLNKKRNLEKVPRYEKNEKALLVDKSFINQRQKNIELSIEDEISKKLEQKGYSKIENRQLNKINEFTIAERLEEKGFFKIQGD
ncbi:hypothetical protein [Fluviispira sanaruensis]|uniref:Uncharacterized protein n=1 Tax=Fluviispira sanaruensis TaxID=2493639 RepID=A0A4P2VP23_FLUSA|nr:hypothetical protein [Fluviispira sanaruensis]BBH54718.1 hypothetical protein JCM31447_31920 [Fluviispira sanaruensis]